MRAWHDWQRSRAEAKALWVARTTDYAHTCMNRGDYGLAAAILSGLCGYAHLPLWRVKRRVFANVAAFAQAQPFNY